MNLTLPLSSAHQILDPTDPDNLHYFSKKWRVKQGQIKEAILHTGSLHPPTIIEYLRRDSFIYHPLEGLKFIFRTTVNFLF